MASEKRLIDVTPENIKTVLKKVPYYPDEIWKFTAMAERFPTVDAVEVVRCKDCKHLTVYNSPTLYAYCQKTHLRFEPFREDTRTHFCSYGERKGNESKAD